MLLAMVCCGAAVLGVTPAPDTTLTLQGVVAVSGNTPGDVGRAVMVLTEPILIGPKQVWILPLGGDPMRWRNWDSRYVEASGVLATRAPEGVRFTPAQIRDVEPDSGSSGEVVSLSHHSNVMLAVVPHRFTAVPGDSTGGITPLIYYKITVQGQTNLTFEFSNNEFVCVSVRAPGEREPGWRNAWVVPQERPPYVIRIGPVFRVLIPIPADVVVRPGRYTVQATVCGNPDFNVTTYIDVSPT
jgi:hypothetical protein